MRVGVKIPQQGLTVREVVISELLCAQGDTVAEGQPVMSIESEKSVLEVEAPAAGTVATIIKSAGDECKVGEIVMYIDI